MQIEFDPATRQALARRLAGYLKAEFDLEIGGMEAVVLLDFVSQTLGPHYYNQALYDGQSHLRAKAEALGEALFDLEKPARL